MVTSKEEARLEEEAIEQFSLVSIRKIHSTLKAKLQRLTPNDHIAGFDVTYGYQEMLEYLLSFTISIHYSYDSADEQLIWITEKYKDIIDRDFRCCKLIVDTVEEQLCLLAKKN